MITLFVITLLAVTGQHNGWLEGKYGRNMYEYRSIAACEGARARIVAYANTLETIVLVSNCTAPDDVVRYDSYFKSPDSTPAPATPSAPTVPMPETPNFETMS